MRERPPDSARDPGAAGGGWRSRTAAVLLSVLAVGLALEAAIRVAQRVTRGVPLTTPLPGYRETRFVASPFLVFGPRVDWQLPGKQIPELARWDAHGFRTIEPIHPRPEGEYRIVAMGGSTTENVWDEAGIHWPLVAQCRLRERGYRVRILNGAMSGYSTAHSLVRLKFQVLDLTDPDMVLVMHLVNDLTVTYEAAAQGREVDPAYLVKYGQKGYTGEVDPSDVILSRLVHTLSRRLRPDPDLRLPPERWSYRLEPGLYYFQRNLRLLADVVRGYEAVPVFLTMPRSSDPDYHRAVLEGFRPGGAWVGPFPEQERFLADFDRFNQAIRDTGRLLGVEVIDLARQVPDSPALFVDPVHHSTAGVLAVGEAVAEGLAALLPPPRPEGPVDPGPECRLLATLDPPT